MGKVGGVLLDLPSNASCFCILHLLHIGTSFFSGFGLMALWRRSLWYAHLSCFSGWLTLASVRQYLVILAYWTSRREHCCRFLRVCGAIESGTTYVSFYMIVAIIWALTPSLKAVLGRFITVPASRHGIPTTLRWGWWVVSSQLSSQVRIVKTMAQFWQIISFWRTRNFRGVWVDVAVGGKVESESVLCHS